jgi:hypothetical protein
MTFIGDLSVVLLFLYAFAMIILFIKEVASSDFSRQRDIDALKVENDALNAIIRNRTEYR